MHTMVLVGTAFAALCISAHWNQKREYMGGSSASKLGLVSASTEVSDPPAAAALDKDKDLDPPTPPGPQEPATGYQIVLNGSNNKLYDCPVVEVTLNSITVFYKGYSGWKIRSTGERIWESMPSRRFRFAASKYLDNGGLTEKYIAFGRDASYPLGMVEVGDLVTLEINNVDGRYLCTGICIERRPGGRVPKAPLDDFPDSCPHHYERANVLQDVEEKGIPVPSKYNYIAVPPHLKNIARFSAPLPREAKR